MFIDKVVRRLEKLDLLKQEFLYFNGDFSKYFRFIKNFEVNTELTIMDDNVGFFYLI